MATGLFHRRSPDGRPAGDHETPADSTTGVTAADAPATERLPAGTTIPQRRLAPGQPVPPGGAVAPRVVDRDRVDTVADRERAEAVTERDRVDSADAGRVEPVHWARTSFTATLSLILGVSATLAALSGRLAPLAVAIGAIGLVFAAAGLAAVARRHVTGHHVALLGLAFSIAGVVFGILAINKALPWLDGGADQAAQLRDWLDAHMSWMRNW